MNLCKRLYDAWTGKPSTPEPHECEGNTTVAPYRDQVFPVGEYGQLPDINLTVMNMNVNDDPDRAIEYSMQIIEDVKKEAQRLNLTSKIPELNAALGDLTQAKEKVQSALDKLRNTVVVAAEEAAKDHDKAIDDDGAYAKEDDDDEDDDEDDDDEDDDDEDNDDDDRGEDDHVISSRK